MVYFLYCNVGEMSYNRGFLHLESHRIDLPESFREYLYIDNREESCEFPIDIVDHIQFFGLYDYIRIAVQYMTVWEIPFKRNLCINI